MKNDIKEIKDTESVLQAVIDYKTPTMKARCGVSIFQCGISPVVILTDLDSEGMSVTNSIEAAASHVYKNYLTMVDHNKISFIEHYPVTDRRKESSFYRVEMGWCENSESYTNPQWKKTFEEGVLNLLLCYGYRKESNIDLSFKKADVLQFVKKG